MKNINAMILVFVVVFLFSACAYEFCADLAVNTEKTNIEFDQFGLPHDVTPGNTRSVYGSSLKSTTEQVERPSADFVDSSGNHITLITTQLELDYYKDHPDLIDVYEKLHDQTYLQDLFEKTYGNNSDKKVHLSTAQTQIFARHKNGKIEDLFSISTWMVKAKGGQKNMKQLGVKIAEQDWGEELQSSDVFLLAPKN